MDFGSIPDLIWSIAVLLVAVAMVSLLAKLGWLIDGYREEMEKEKE